MRTSNDFVVAIVVYERKMLYSIGRFLMRFDGISRKQLLLANDIIIKAKRLGVDRKVCRYKSCDRCKEIAAYNPRADSHVVH